MSIRELPASAALDLWLGGESLCPAGRAVALAAAAAPSSEDVEALPLGRRDRLILELHGTAPLAATAACPACGERAELALDPAELLALEPAVPQTVPGLEWRLPDSRDLAAAGAAGDPAEAERVLLARCVEGEPSAEGRRAVAEAMAAADPLAELLVELDCPACGSPFAAEVEVAALVWAELRTEASRLLRQVDALARAYGWTEAEVLALDDRRRRAYLALLGEDE